MDKVLTFSLSVVTLICIFTSVFSQDLKYEIFEEEDPNFYVGNIASDIELWTSVPSTEFQTLTYSFLTQGNLPHSSYFTIDSKSSILRTASVLNREVLCEYDITCVLSLEVAAQSSVGVFFRRIKIDVILKDVNDHSPNFVTRNVNLELSESSVVGTLLSIDGAVDSDIGNNSVQSYSLLPENSPFIVKFTKYMDGRSVVQLEVAEELDRETTDSYSIQVIAIDGGSPPRSDTLNVKITIADYNDNPPNFVHSSYEVTINEDIAIGTGIIILSATDADIGENGKINYALSLHQSDKIHILFAINKTSGEMSVISPLMYEATKNYRIIVEASDHAENSLISQTEVLVSVLDSNNNAPEININVLNEGKISEYANIGAVVAHVRVVDADSGINGKVKCQISSNKLDLQYLDVNEFKVTVGKSLNREISDRLEVELFCNDLGSPSLNQTAQFTITVLDENDNSPRFYQQNYFVQISENNEINKLILQVEATDYDLSGSINAEIIYFLDKLSPYDFHVDSISGIITAGSVLDRENLNDSDIEFKVFAHDGGSPSLTGSATIFLTILDENDNHPEFLELHYKFPFEEMCENFSVGTVVAFDSDAGENGTILYTMSPDFVSTVPFEIKQDGEVRAISKLDREFQDSYTFVVFAKDDGLLSLSSSVNVIVQLSDINDNRPQFVFPVANNNTVFVSYHTSVLSVIATVHANDKDVGENARIVYTVENENFTDMLNIDPHTGEISVVRQLDTSDLQIYRFNITARDNGDQVLQSSQTLEIRVIASDIFTPSTPDKSNQNILIVISIVCVTLVLSAAIILIICMIRCVDRKGKKYLASQKKDPKDCQSLDQKNGMKEKKVSFYFGSNSRNQTMNVDQEKEQDSYHIQIQDMDSKQMQNDKTDNILYLDRSESTSQNRDTPKADMTSCDTSTSASQLSAFKRHHSLLQSHDQIWLNDSSELPLTKDFMKHHDDSHSESSGETTTSDSGRGGSEDEITSNGGHSHSRDSDLMKHMQNTNTIAQILHQSCPHKSQWRNSERYSNSRTDPRDLMKPRYHSTSTVNSIKPCTTKSEMHRVYSPIKNMAPHNPWPARGEYLDNSFCTYDDDDDDETTTSGSYTIDPDDLCTELPISRPRDCIV